VDRSRAERLAEAGVEVAMLDVIGAEATIREVYHLDRPVADFEAALEALVATPLRVVPHVAIGLHYGRVLGEFKAIEIIARHRVDACILVVVMPAFTRPGRFRAVDPIEVADVFLAARELLPQSRVLLGCARPPGAPRRLIDPYALLAGLDAIAFPASLLWRRRSAARLPRPMPAARSVPAGAERSRRARDRARTRWELRRRRGCARRGTRARVRAPAAHRLAGAVRRAGAARPGERCCPSRRRTGVVRSGDRGRE
jgi:hypothetical protein